MVFYFVFRNVLVEFYSVICCVMYIKYECSLFFDRIFIFCGKDLSYLR